MTSKSGNCYSPELRERAVRMLLEQRDNYASDNAAVKSIAPKIGCSPDTLRAWLRQHERDSNGGDGGLSTVNVSVLKNWNARTVNCGAVTISCARLRHILRRRSSYIGRLLFCQVIVAILVPAVKIAVVYPGSLCVSLSYAAHNGICLLAPKRPLSLERKAPDYRTPRDVPAPV